MITTSHDIEIDLSDCDVANVVASIEIQWRKDGRNTVEMASWQLIAINGLGLDLDSTWSLLSGKRDWSKLGREKFMDTADLVQTVLERAEEAALEIDPRADWFEDNEGFCHG